MEQIKTLEERENSLIEKGKVKGFITYEELAFELKGLDIDNDALDNLYNKLVENNISVVAEADVDADSGEACSEVFEEFCKYQIYNIQPPVSEHEFYPEASVYDKKYPGFLRSVHSGRNAAFHWQ